MCITRRSVLFLSGAAIALAACSSTTVTLSQLAADVQLVASGISSVVAAVAQIPGVPATTVTQLQGYLATIQIDAGKVASATPSAVAGTSIASIVEEIAVAVQAVAEVALPLIPGGSAAVPILNAAVSLLPIILDAAGIAGATKAVGAYTPDQARLILSAVK
jgi:hypothetical protein